MAAKSDMSVVVEDFIDRVMRVFPDAEVVSRGESTLRTNGLSNQGKAALWYAKQGWPVLPLHTPRTGSCSCRKDDCQSQGKHPRTQRGLKDATTEEGAIRSWWTRWPDANVAVLTGTESGLIVLDVDPRNGGDESLANLEDEFGRLPATVESRTGGGGRHYFFNHPRVPIRCSSGKLGPGLDLKSDGGYIVVPPSVHGSGNTYQWRDSSKPNQIQAAPLPGWLLDRLTQQYERSPADEVGEGNIPEGRRNETLTSMGGRLRSMGMTTAEIRSALLEANRGRCATPLDDMEVERIAESLGRYPPRSSIVTNSNEWEHPIPLLVTNLPEFPTPALPDWVKEFVEAEATATQTPPDLAGMLTISVCAAAIAKKVVVNVREGYQEPVNVFIVVVLPPGSRKSAVFSHVTSPLEEYEATETERLRSEIAEQQSQLRIATEALRKAEKKAAEAKWDKREAAFEEANKAARELAAIKVSQPPRLVVDDCSPERLSTLLQEQGGRIAVMAPEGDVFDLIAGRYSSGGPNLGVYLRGHAGDLIRVDRVSRASEFVESPALTVGLAVQPEVLNGLTRVPGFRGRGLIGRFLFALPHSRLGCREISPPSVPSPVKSEYRKNVQALLSLPFAVETEGAPAPHTLSFDFPGQEALMAFASWLEPQLAETGDLGHMTDWAGKLVGAVARLAGILHMAEYVGEKDPWSILIDLPTVKRAIQIGHYLIHHAKAAFGEMGADQELDDARHLLNKIQSLGVTEITRRDLFESVKGRFKKVDKMDPGLGLLADHGYIRRKEMEDSSARGRKPSLIYEVNPLLPPELNRCRSATQKERLQGTQVNCANCANCATPT
ncbi:MAG: DUF3987 domain-containing protein [Candidatus Eisenbacteria bacterium]|uniref:DUF3987 domain-containing protein n=1 Tax=Eiseniibacteriota bacterium TaxID=2212470 RepID=A0A948RVG2_UNCEI|nr:DUF3987 domain-containing protein [Candidatus Eisenbacteria bacterium]MBU2691760.1 DUF3987 domain-containing protein [Candidatus Eisenbacteria bacterium]